MSLDITRNLEKNKITIDRSIASGCKLKWVTSCGSRSRALSPFPASIVLNRKWSPPSLNIFIKIKLTIHPSRWKITKNRWPRPPGGRSSQGYFHWKVIGTLKHCPYIAGGRSSPGPLETGSTVPPNFRVFVKFCICHVILLKSRPHDYHIYLRTTRFPN